MAIDYLMFQVPNNWNGEEDFFTARGQVKRAFKQIFWRLMPDEESVLASRVDGERFSFGGDGVDNAQKATGKRFLSMWHESDGNYIYPRKEIFEEMRDSLEFIDEYTDVKLRCFIRNVLDAVSKSKQNLILISW